MAYEPFKADVLSPGGQVFSGEVQQISTRTVSGELGVLRKHQPLLGRLEAGELRLYLPNDGEVKRLVQTGGYIQVAGDGGVLLLVDEAYPVEDYDRAQAEADQQKAAERLDAAEEGTEQHRLALAGKKRADALVKLGDKLEKR
ncbi:ATP synthase F1 subunit epsilon [Patulibacter sp.]|uniref:ATP synthase F1 subunit epsilon n=1 Tax=Patulibacter sp. TaxID=1912859 RepID=UPI0027260DAA|nr:ATP synthase F1 subunit epsilon [Patulibacter sp.]MDO9408497.1 ATP synthase F1 subunit epsilon [Patulibacter sp.]